MALFVDLIKLVSAAWANRAPRLHWGTWLDVQALLHDAFAEAVEETRLAGMPGQVDDDIAPNLGDFHSVDALWLIGRDRRIQRGLAETSAAYALRLRRWLDSWSASGTVLGVLDALAGAVDAPGQTPPMIRIFNLHGDWWTRESDGTIVYQNSTGTGWRYSRADGTLTPDTTAAVVADWDSATDPPPGDQGDPTRFYAVIYTPAASPYLTATDGVFGDPGVIDDGYNDFTHGTYSGSPDAGTVGTNAPHQLLERLRGAVESQRAAGFKCAYFILAFDPSSFNPDGSSTYYPGGTWGHHTTYSSFLKRRLIARDPTAEYCPATPGGRAP